MQLLIACSTFALSVALAVKRPALSSRIRISPATAALAGVLCLLVAGSVHPVDVVNAAEILWRPLITILAIMITTAAARQTGTIDVVAARVLGPRATSVTSLFTAVFVLGLATASILSNDAAILLLTPLVVLFVRSRYPAHQRLLLPFAFAVFMSAGVAPFVTSNPMNIVVASFAGLDFNGYAWTMLPISIVGSIVTYFLLRRMFAHELASVRDAPAPAVISAVFSRQQKQMLLLLAAVATLYPFASLFDNSSIWAVAASGALLSLALAARASRGAPNLILRRGVSWDVLVFLPAVFVLAIGLRNAGVTALLSNWYEGAGLWTIGVTSAVGSAALNNHPMALINMLSLAAPSFGDPTPFLAAVIGGDLGPRLLPTGSLAGLLWIEACQQLDVDVTPARFVRLGIVLTLPVLLVSLAALVLMRGL